MAKLVHKTKRQLETWGPKECTCSENKGGCGKTKSREEFSITKYGSRGFKYNDLCRDCLLYKRNNKKKHKKSVLKTAHKNYIERHPEKIYAHRVARGMINRGEITREPCCICGAEDSQMHHPDYAFPEKVIFLCKKHHNNLHLNRLDEIENEIVDDEIRRVFNV